MIEFSKFNSKNWVRVEDASVNDLPLFNNRGVLDQIDSFCKEFDEVPLTEIFSNVSNLVADFGSYLCQCVVSKVAYQVAVQWPPLIPRVHPSIPSFIILLAKILNRMKNPTHFMYFIRNAFFTKMWTQKSSLQNQYIVALCRCTFDKKDVDHWAIIDRDRNFALYEVKKDSCVEKIKCQIGKCFSSSDKKDMQIIDLNQRVVCKFTPCEKAQIQLWDLVYSRQKVPFPFYYTSTSEFFPDIMYRAFYNSVVSNDTIIVNAIMESTELCEQSVWEALIKCFCYAQKITILAETVFSNTFMYPNELTNESFDKPSHFIMFARALGKLYFRHYWDLFFYKVAQLVDFHDDLDLTDLSLVDPKACELVVFNVLKYIMQSAYAIPTEWRYVMNILRSYLNVRYNSEALTTLGLSAFFGHGIIETFFRENIDFFKDASIQHTDTFSIFAYILSIPFSLNVFGGNTEHFKAWNRRLENHFFPRWEQFLLNISDYDGEYFKPEPPELNSLGYSLNVLMKQVMQPDMSEKLKNKVCDMLDNNLKAPTLCGWNLCCLLSHLFVQAYDPEEKQSKKKKKAVVSVPRVALPNLPSFTVGGAAKGTKSGSGGGGTRGGVTNSPTPVRVRGSGRGMPVVKNTETAQLDDADPFDIVDEGANMFFVPGTGRNFSVGNNNNHGFFNGGGRGNVYDDEVPTTMTLPDLPAASKFNPITYTDSDAPPSTDDSDISFTPSNMRNPDTKFEIQATGGKKARNAKKSSQQKEKITTFESNFDDIEFSDDLNSSTRIPPAKISIPPQSSRPVTVTTVSPDQIKPSEPLPTSPKIKSRVKIEENTDDSDDMHSFLRTLGSDTEEVKKQLNTEEKRKYMMMVQVDPATVTNDPSQPRQKLYRKVQK